MSFEAPRFAYDDGEPAQERLLALVDAFGTPSGTALFGAADVDSLDGAARMAAYFEARNLFLRSGVGVGPGRDIRELVGRLRAPLLAAVRTSRDFSAAYNPLLSMAYRLSQVDPTMAGALLRDLEIANPARPEAREMRRRLAPR